MSPRVGFPAGRARRVQTTSRVLIALVVFVLLVVGVAACGSYYKDRDVTITVTQKESVNTEDGHEYRVYTQQEGAFVMKDTIIKGRLDTADEYGALEEGRTYRCKAFGYRVPFFSSFENLHSCKPAPAPPGSG